MQSESKLSKEEPLDLCCAICRKNCGSKVALKRHLTYCRRKVRINPRPRKRSCLSCTKAKTQCDLGAPECSRCIARHLDCIYQHKPQTSSEGSSFELPSEFEQIDSGSLRSASQVAHRDADKAEDLEKSKEAATGQLSNNFLTSVPTSPIAEWTPSQTSRSWYNSNTTSGDGEIIALPSSVTSYVHELDSSLRFNESIFAELYNLGSPGALDLNPIRSHSRAFSPRKTDSIQSSLIRAHVLSILRSYPDLLLSDGSLPPFVHPRCSIYKAQDFKAHWSAWPTFAGPLAICRSILQMFKARNAENNSFIWNTVRGAQEKLARELASYNDWETVAAFQAVTLYLCLRIRKDEDTEDSDLDVPLIQTMFKISLKVNRLSRSYASVSDNFMPSWQDWTMTESIRRAMIVILFIERLFDIRAGLPNFDCDGTYLRSMTLPCSRKLWNAGNEDTWEAEYLADSHAHSQGGSFRYKDLINLNSLTNTSQDLLETPLDGWLAQMDDLGTLVVAAASISL